MVSVNSQFHSLITDEDVPQILLLCECAKNATLTGAYYSSIEGDISDDGATFTDDMVQGDDYRVGCVSSRTMSVSIMNLDGSLNGHNFGWLMAFVGAYVSTSTQTLGTGVNAQFTFGGVTYYAKTTGFYADSTLVFPGNVTGLFGAKGYVYFFLTTTSGTTPYSYKISNGTVDNANISARDCAKYAVGKSVLVDQDNGELYMTNEDGDVDLYYIACLGHYRVDKPQNTMSQKIHITDAFDLVHELDAEATEALTKIKNMGYPPLYCYPFILFFLGAYNIGCELDASAQGKLGMYVPRLDNLLQYSYTGREIVGYLCELCGCNARLKPGTSKLQLYHPNGETDAENYPILANRIEVQSVCVQEYVTPRIDSFTVVPTGDDFGRAGTSKTYPPDGGDCTYIVTGNPFNMFTFRKASILSLGMLQNIPTFYPMTFNVINADPSFQIGDMVAVGFYTENEELTTYDEDEITTYSGDTITVNPPIGYNLPVGMQYIPIMSQTLRFSGRCYATIESKGSAERGESNSTYTSANSRTNALANAGQIAEDVLASAVSLTASTTTGTNLCSVTLDAGTWMLYGYVQFSAVSGGARRVVCISSTSGSLTDTIRNDSQVTTNIVTTHSVSGVVTPSASTTYYLNACSSAACSANATNTLLLALRLM